MVSRKHTGPAVVPAESWLAIVNYHVGSGLERVLAGISQHK